MSLFYTIGIYIYSLLLHLAVPFNEKARLFVRGRKNWKASLAELTRSGSSSIWFHFASLGEFEQGRPVLEGIREQYPSAKIIVTFYSPSGYEIRKNYEQADVVSYLPLDTPRNARVFLDLIRPSMVFFIKYEFWYHYINELHKRQIPLYLVSAIFRKNQQFFRNTPWGRWYRKNLFRFAHFFVQNETSCDLLSSIGITNYTQTGDTRFDRVSAIAKQAKELPIVEKFKGDTKLIVAGSTWKPDEEMLAAFINQNEDVKFIVAPHVVSEANINRLLQLLKNRAILYSQADEHKISGHQVLIIDSVGLLSSVYRYGEIAYIGGGFGVGIHNTLEAATFGLPIIFGPNYKRFREAVDLVSDGGAFPVMDSAALMKALNRLISDEKFYRKSSGVCHKYVEKNVGSTKLIIKKVFNTPGSLD